MMRDNMYLRSVLVLSAAAILGLAATSANAVISIDFDSNNAVQSDDPNHLVGMTLPGQVGDWYKLSTSGSPGSPEITTTEGPTFTFNTTGEDFRRYAPAGTKLLREDFYWLTDGYGPIEWTLTDLTPNGVYDIICYGRYDPAYGGYRGADMSIVGYNDDNPVAQEHGATVMIDEVSVFVPEGDWNFPSVTADATGTITGIFAWGSQAHAEFGGIQFQELTFTGDADGDGDVDSADYIMIKTHFGGAPGAEGVGGDLDGSGIVDWADLQILQDAYNAASDANPVPEPATMMLLLGAGLPALLKRRRSRS